MKRIKLGILMVALWGLNSCKNNKESDNLSSTLTVTTTDVNAFEIVSILLQTDFSDKHSGSFDDQKIDLLKTSDTTLSFMIPDVKPGKHWLKTEFGNIEFTVISNKVVVASETIGALSSNFDVKIGEFNPVDSDGLALKDSLIKRKIETINLFNSLSEKDKQLACQIYEANIQPVNDCNIAINNLINAETVLRRGGQSDCPTTDYKGFYDCTANNLGTAAMEIKPIARKFIEMLGCAGAMYLTAQGMSALGPAAIGIAAVGISVPMALATYMLFVDLAPAVGKLWNAAGPFLKANWILSKEMFNNANTDFMDDVATSLKLKPAFQSLSATTVNVTAGTVYYHNAMNALNGYLIKLKALFGESPTYQNSSEPTTLNSNEIDVSNISNSNVQFVGNSGEALRFKSLSGQEESFNYKITVNKEGFSVSSNLSGTVKPIIDSTAYYTQQCIGSWIVDNLESTSPAYTLEVYADGTGKYTGTVSEPFTNGGYKMTWYVTKVNNKYYFNESGFWHPGYNQFRVIDKGKSNENLDNPVTTFSWYSDLGDGKGPYESIKYNKN